jgi:hypothetical protein
MQKVTQQADNELEQFRNIAAILWNEWDPIGINDKGPIDEYDSYVCQILQLKKAGKNIETIAQLLNDIAINDMGLQGNIEHCRLVAIKIAEINEK